MAKHDETGPIGKCYDCGALLYASLGQCDICRLKGRIVELEADLLEFGRHAEGCNYVYDAAYGCKCGWLEIEQALKGGDK